MVIMNINWISSLTKKRIFIAIPLSQETCEKITEAIERLRWLPIRWIPQKNWHVTVIPPFLADNGGVAAILSEVQKRLEKFSSFPIDFEAVVLAPPGQKARMIWLTGLFSPRLQELKDAFGDLFQGKFLGSGHEGDGSRLLPHITLARFSEGEMSDLEVKTRILENLKNASLSFEAKEVCVMESRFMRAGVEYETLFCVPFSDAKEERGALS